MEKTIKVSVIMLAYNIGKYVETAIKGVLRQKTAYAIQLVISEDCSTDNTLDICLRYQQQYPEIITLVRHPQNVGLQRNFMDAHRHCTGEYIAICDGDDYWFDCNKLQRMTDFMDTHPSFALCFHRVINYYEENNTKSLSNGHQSTVTDIIDLCRSNYITNSSSLFRRRYFPELPEWFAQATSCDYAMHMLNAQYGKIYYFKKPMAVYRKHIQGIWSEVGMGRQVNFALTVRELLIEYFQEKRPDVSDCIRQAHTGICLNLIRHYRKAGQTAQVSETSQRLLKYQPQWTLDDVKRQEILPSQNVGKMIKIQFRKILTRGREIISKYIPLPRING